MTSLSLLRITNVLQEEMQYTISILLSGHYVKESLNPLVHLMGMAGHCGNSYSLLLNMGSTAGTFIFILIQ